MKVCDAADFFAPDFTSIVSGALQEVPKLHRKQWEFAIIFDRLHKAGVLRDDASGISFGAGRERLLYALANRVGRLWATDLYSASSVWPGAKADDPQAFVLADPGMATRLDRLSVKNMDMRQIDFPDESFDFAYSSSAVEHIGGWEDFKAHLAEVRRVLKPGGVYVMTTDIIYGPAWEEVGNFKFDPDGLRWWLAESEMAYGPVVDCRIARHLANAPLPTELMTCLTPDGVEGRPNLFQDLCQVQMLMGRHPHSSVVLEMRKTSEDRPSVAFPCYEDTKAFLLETRSVWERFAAGSRLNPHPAPIVPAHLREQYWATAYLWLGSAPRTVVVRVQTEGPGNITIGVNKAHTDRFWVPVVEIPLRVEATTGYVVFELSVSCDPDWNYAVYGTALDGLKLVDVAVTIRESGAILSLPPAARWVAEQEMERRIAELRATRSVGDAELTAGTVGGAPPVQAGPGMGHVARTAAMVNRLLRPAGIRIARARY